jgi:hypothetical protein
MEGRWKRATGSNVTGDGTLARKMVLVTVRGGRRILYPDVSPKCITYCSKVVLDGVSMR